MPRAGPVYTLPEAPFVPNTPIVSADVNADFSDIATALTNSLARNGSGGMTAVLPLVTDGFNFLVDPDTGVHRIGDNTIGIKAGGVDAISVGATAVGFVGSINVLGQVFQNFNPLLMIGEIKIWPSFNVPNVEWLICNGQTALRSDYPDLWTFAANEIASGSLLFTNGNGTTTFTLPDFSGRVLAMRDSTGTRLTNATMTPNGNTYGATGGQQTETLVVGNIPGLPALVNDSNPNGGSSTGISRGTSTGSGTLPIIGAATTPVINVQPTIIVNYIIYAGHA